MSKTANNDSICRLAYNSVFEYCSEMGLYCNGMNGYRQIRIKGCKTIVDIYPLGRKWHNIKTQQRGTYKDLIGFIMITFID